MDDRTSVSVLMGLLFYCIHTDRQIHTQMFPSLYCHMSVMSFSDTMRSSGREPSVKIKPDFHNPMGAGTATHPGGCN